MALVLEPEIATSLELGAGLAFGTTDLVDGVVDELDRMELVEGDLGLGEVVVDALDEDGAHVDADFFDARWIAVVGFKVVSELGNGIGILAVGDIKHAALIDIDEEGDVVVAAPGRRFIDGDALHVSGIGALTPRLDPVMEAPPHSG